MRTELKKTEKITEVNLKRVPAYAKPFIEKILYPFLNLKFAEEGTTINPDSVTAWQSDTIEDLHYNLNNVFLAFREEIQKKKKNNEAKC